MDENKVLAARDKAGGLFRDGYNCSEAIFLAFHELLNLPVDRETVKMLTGFGGGLGHAGCMCGALVSSAAVLNILFGRTDNKGDRKQAYAITSEFHDRFLDKFGATCCRALNQAPFDTPEHLRCCLKITGNTGKLLMEYLQEKGI